MQQTFAHVQFFSSCFSRCKGIFLSALRETQIERPALCVQGLFSLLSVVVKWLRGRPVMSAVENHATWQEIVSVEMYQDS